MWVLEPLFGIGQPAPGVLFAEPPVEAADVVSQYAGRDPLEARRDLFVTTGTGAAFYIWRRHRLTAIHSQDVKHFPEQPAWVAAKFVEECDDLLGTGVVVNRGRHAARLRESARSSDDKLTAELARRLNVERA